MLAPPPRAPGEALATDATHRSTARRGAQSIRGTEERTSAQPGQRSSSTSHAPAAVEPAIRAQTHGLHHRSPRRQNGRLRRPRHRHRRARVLADAALLLEDGAARRAPPSLGRGAGGPAVRRNIHITRSRPPRPLPEPPRANGRSVRSFSYSQDRAAVRAARRDAESDRHGHGSVLRAGTRVAAPSRCTVFRADRGATAGRDVDIPRGSERAASRH